MTTSILRLTLMVVVSVKLSIASAQVFTTLHSFDNYYAEGANPYAGVILSSNFLYGVTKYEGSSRSGVAFGVRVDGVGFTNLHNFLGFPGESGSPDSELILSSNALYGTSPEGTLGFGTVFKISLDDTGLATLHTFTAGSDGSGPHGPLILSGGVLFGTTLAGLGAGGGTIFQINTDGGEYTNLYNFSAAAPTNIDGASPCGGLILLSNRLYGTTSAGGSAGAGTVFGVDITGSNFTTLHHFSAVDGSYPFYTNADGANPPAGLVLSGSTLYGVAQNGGSGGAGTIFAINTDGSNFLILHNFSDPVGSGPYYSNEDGIFPEAALTLSGDTLYGTAYGGGISALGTLFAIKTNGTDFEVLHAFGGADGENPTGRLMYHNQTLYGTTAFGGMAQGTVFSLLLEPPLLEIEKSETNVVLKWPLNAVGYSVESATNLTAPVIWQSLASEPIILGDDNAVTNSILERQEFYRLSRSLSPD